MSDHAILSVTPQTPVAGEHDVVVAGAAITAGRPGARTIPRGSLPPEKTGGLLAGRGVPGARKARPGRNATPVRANLGQGAAGAVQAPPGRQGVGI